MKGELRTHTVLVGLIVPVLAIGGLAYWSAGPAPEGALVQFSTYGEFEAFLDRTGSHAEGGSWSGDTATTFGGNRFGGALAAEGTASGTNVQVAGIDELDFVKTDGTYLFVASGERLRIVRASPASAMEVVGTIEAREATGGRMEYVAISGLFLAEDLVIVVVSGWEATEQHPSDRVTLGMLWYPGVGYTYVAGFDVSDVRAPRLLWTHGISGNPSTARMTDGHVYVVVTDWIQRSETTYLTPSRCSSATCAPLSFRSIWYDPESPETASVTHVLGVRAEDGETNLLSVLLGATSTVYMTHSSLYLTVPKWEATEPTSMPTVGETDPWTTIHRVAVDRLDLRPAASGDVPGTLLNQWAMDESDGRLRVATTVGWREPSSGVYVLDRDLARVGALEGIAPTERIFAARYVGDTLYLVTFRQIDPLFVVDLSVPESPRIAGELKIPGFSSYLHPFADGRLVGIGQEDGAVKVSLFDVSDPTRPAEVDAQVLPHSSWSPALWDHKAVLANPTTGLLVVPVDSWAWEVGAARSGAYVFRIDAEGIALRGTVPHEGNWVERALYIGDVLYVLSRTTLVSARLGDLSVVGSLSLG